MTERPARNTIVAVSAFKGLTPKQLGFDALIAVVLLALGTFVELPFGDRSFVEYSREAGALHYVLIALMAAPIALRRVYPVPVLATVLGAWVIDRGLDYPDTPAAFGVFIAFYTIGAELDRNRSALIGGISSAVILLWTTVGLLSLESVTVMALFTTAIATITPLLLGREIHSHRERMEELRRRAELAEREREERAKQAVVEERARIARELHDVVAHQMTVMTLQAEGATRIASNADPRLADALETIRVAGHEALAELRRTVGLLREDEGNAETRPLPKLADIEQLVTQMRAAGMEVDLKVSGDRKTLSDSAELAVYRIIQESLTNVIRHGGPDASTAVHIAYAPDELEVSITDNGRGAGTTNRGEGGHGLIGMRERVAVLGGEFEAGPKSGGGFRVHATIPSHS